MWTQMVRNTRWFEDEYLEYRHHNKVQIFIDHDLYNVLCQVCSNPPAEEDLPTVLPDGHNEPPPMLDIFQFTETYLTRIKDP